MHGWRHQRRRGLRTWIIMMIRRTPKNGAETMTQGWWRPSPGSVYPTLDELAKDGLIRKREDGRYELTDRGKESIEWPFGAPSPRPQSLDEMLNEVSGIISYLEDLDKSDKPQLEPHKQRMRGIANRLAELTR